VVDSYRIDPDLICGRMSPALWGRRMSPAVAVQKAAVARLGDSDDRVMPRRGDEEETPVKARTSDDEDRR
jgi:hypothetical protein